MQASVLRRGDRPLRPTLLRIIRVVGVALTAAMGLIHLWLWLQGYRDVPVIGALFMINAICAAALVLALLAVPVGLRGPVAGVAALFTAETLGGLVVSLTVGLFGVHESLQTPFVLVTLIVETAGVLVLTAMMGMARKDPGRQA
ncbi:MAG: hypothetical protein ACRDTX_24955 [Pseudonocardiaceae bacterium]